MSNAQRLHPVSVIFDFIEVIRHTIYIFIPVFFGFKDELIYVVLISAGILLILFISVFLSWWRFTYRIEADEIRIEKGVFVRKKRYISKNRIQSIDLTANVIHRIFKLVKVEIETAGGESAEASLSAVKRSEGEWIRSELKSFKKTEESSVETSENEQPIEKISFKRLFIAGTTSGSIGVILTITALGSQGLENMIPESFFEETWTWVIGLSIVLIVGLVILMLLLLWLLGLAGTMLKYGNFTITKNEEELFITRGLLEKKQLTIPMRRIQAVGIKQNLIRQPLGFVTLFAVVAGGSRDEREDFPVIFPLMKVSEVDSFLKTFLPTYGDISNSLVALPKRSMKFYFLRASVLPVILIVVVAYSVPSFIWIPIVILLFSLILGYLRYKDAGYVIEGKRMTLQVRLLSKVKLLMYHRRVQAFENKQNKIQSIQHLASVTFSIIGSLGGSGAHYTIKDMEEKDALKLAEWYSYRS